MRAEAVTVAVLVLGVAARAEPIHEPYRIDFESPTFTAGWLGTQGGVYAFGSATQPQVCTLNPSEGTQHLRLARDEARPSGQYVGAGALLPTPFTTGEHVRISVDVAISSADGANYYIGTSDAGQPAWNFLVEFNASGAIRAVDSSANGLSWRTLGAWSPGSYQTLTIDVTLGSALSYYYADALLYHDPNGIPEYSPTLSLLVIYSDNAQQNETGDFDDITITPMPEPPALVLLSLGVFLCRRR